MITKSRESNPSIIELIHRYGFAGARRVKTTEGKPRIRKVRNTVRYGGNAWVCSSTRYLGRGPNVALAYANWLASMQEPSA